MNNPLAAEPGWIRNALVAFGIAIVGQGVYGLYALGELKGEFFQRMEVSENQNKDNHELIGKLDEARQNDTRRIDRLEGQATSEGTIVNRLDTAREDANVHFTKVDGRLDAMDSKLGAILEIVQQARDEDGGAQTNAPPNFTRGQPQSHTHP